MLNKLTFNNLVISNKKGIQQSRIQTINKLVNKIRKLQALAKKHPDDKKIKERVRKSTETLELLKKIKRVDIMKKVLLMDKPPAAVITNGLATPEEVVVALLAMNKVMAGLIKRFKTELLLDDSKRDEWQQVLTEASKRLQKKQRTLEKHRKRLEMKQQNNIRRRRQEWLEQNCSKTENQNSNENCEDMNISTTGNWSIETLADKVEEDKEGNIGEKRSLKDKLKNADIPNKKQKKSIEKVYEHKNELDAAKTENSPLEFDDYKDDENVEESKAESLVVDPFFITDTGEHYLSTAVVKKDQTTCEDNSEENSYLHMIKLNNDKKPADFKNRVQQSRNKNRKDLRNKSPTKDHMHSEKTNLRSNYNNRDNKRHNTVDYKSKDFSSNKSVTESSNKNLHPSWAAKQKLKPIITSFQGKKIKFDDAESNNNQVTHHQNKNTEQPNFKANNVEQVSLHPSWAAKQKLKPTITAFQGKKITFDNDD